MNAPVLYPCWMSAEATIAVVLPLPFVPATCTAGIARCGWSNRLSRASMRLRSNLTRGPRGPRNRSKSTKPSKSPREDLYSNVTYRAHRGARQLYPTIPPPEAYRSLSRGQRCRCQRLLSPGGLAPPSCHFVCGEESIPATYEPAPVKGRARDASQIRAHLPYLQRPESPP